MYFSQAEGEERECLGGEKELEEPSLWMLEIEPCLLRVMKTPSDLVEGTWSGAVMCMIKSRKLSKGLSGSCTCCSNSCLLSLRRRLAALVSSLRSSSLYLNDDRCWFSSSDDTIMLCLLLVILVLRFCCFFSNLWKHRWLNKRYSLYNQTVDIKRYVSVRGYRG